MIAHVCGIVRVAGPTWVVIEVGGIGLHLLCPPATAAAVRVGEAATLHTALVVREDSLTLYGFAEQDDKDAFMLVQTATGVGPKLAQGIVSVLSAAELRQAILSENLARLTSVPGIGRKGAQRIVIELKDKVAAIGLDEPDLPPRALSAWREQLEEGLIGLGWSAKDAAGACDNVAQLADDNPDISIGELMRAALASLAKRR